MDDQNKIYEIGFHFIPTIAEEQLPEEVSKIKSVIEAEKGSVIADEFPKLRQLAFSIDAIVGSTKHAFDKAYFGWIKFESTVACAEAVKQALSQNTLVMRHLLTKTTREQTIVAPTFSENREDTVKEETNEPEVLKKPINEKQLDETIDELVIE